MEFGELNRKGVESMKKVVVGGFLLLGGIILYAIERFASLKYLQLQGSINLEDFALHLLRMGDKLIFVSLIMLMAGVYLLFREAIFDMWNRRNNK